MQITNSYAGLPERFFAAVRTDAPPQPRLFAWNAELADELGLDALSADAELRQRVFSGNAPLPGGKTIALAYAGHQFGQFVPQLGDGRAALLGEALRPSDGCRFDIQLKGSGPTPFSRRGDGKSSLGPVIREYLLSEAMHRLGVPTSRALAAVSTGELVRREQLEPGGILTRVAASHIRVGTFQFFAARQDAEALQQLADYAMARHYPDTTGAGRPLLAFFEQVVIAQARLVAHWMTLGFIHGVMNTDNCAISGETLDYGPCAFLDEFDINKVFSSIDRHGRYAYGQQAAIAQWNLARLAECLLLLDDSPDDFSQALESFQPAFEQTYFGGMGRRLGLVEPRADDSELITAYLQQLQDGALDYHLSFQQLAGCLDDGHEPAGFGAFEQRWLARIDAQPGGRRAAARQMAASNPLVMPRNHQVERVIEAAFDGDFEPFEQMRQALAEPFSLQPGLAGYAEAPAPGERVRQTFCGT